MTTMSGRNPWQLAFDDGTWSQLNPRPRPLTARAEFSETPSPSSSSLNDAYKLVSSSANVSFRSVIPRSRMQPIDLGRPNGSLLRPLSLGSGMVQTEPNSPGHVRNESGNKSRSSQLCRPQVRRVVSAAAAFPVGER